MSDELTRLIRDASRLLQRALAARARLLGVTREQWMALVMLSRQEGINQTRFADLMDMEPIGLCRMVDRLEAAGLVRRERDSADRRARRLYLTRAGWALLDQLRPLGLELAAKGAAGIDPAQIGAACAVLEQMIANLTAEASAEASARIPAGGAA